jgi:predicted PhzF superfamily epimerase YddE/YHI9
MNQLDAFATEVFRGNPAVVVLFIEGDIYISIAR